MTLKVSLIAVSFISLFLSLIIYLLFRTKSIWLIGFMESRFLYLHNFRKSTLEFNNQMPSWVIFNLPDGLFAFSYTSLMAAIWTEHKRKVIWILLLPVLLIAIEILQKLQFTKGTFDPLDIVFILIFTFLTFLITKNNHEKNN